MSAIEHPSDEILAALWSEDLPAAETERILEHLECCPTCEQRLNRIDPSIRQYRRFVEIVDAHMPGPERPWGDIWPEMERADRRKDPVAIQPSKRWPVRALYICAAAAALLLAVGTWSRGISVVRAESLLNRAQTAAGHNPSRAHLRLRIGTRKTSFVRPAVLTEDSASRGFGTQFLAARYDWSDPLSAAAFSGWRKQLRKKWDRVSVSGQPAQYRIETTTDDSILRDALMTFEGPNLTPVSLKLLFADEEWVEITALSGSPEVAAATVPGSAPVKGITSNTPVAESSLTDVLIAERELQVRLAIDALAGETPAPVTVEVTSTGSIEVTPYHLPQGQERELRASLSGVEGVVLKQMERDPEPAGAEAVPQNNSEPAIGIAGTVTSLAHLLAEQADRFPAAREAQLRSSGREALQNLRERHAARLNLEIDRLGRQLADTRPIASDGESLERNRSATSLAELVGAAGKLNRLVTAIYATGADHVEASTAWPEISAEWNRVRRLGRAYARYLETAQEAPR